MNKRGYRAIYYSEEHSPLAVLGSESPERNAAGGDGDPPINHDGQSRSNSGQFLSAFQAILTCAALFVGALWVIEMKPPEEPTTPIRVDSWEPTPEDAPSDGPYGESLTVFLVATEEHARRIDAAIEQGNVETGVLKLPMLRYEIVVIPSHESAAYTGFRYSAEARGSQDSQYAVQVVDLRASQ